jgi:hypothetical protein
MTAEYMTNKSCTLLAVRGRLIDRHMGVSWRRAFLTTGRIQMFIDSAWIPDRSPAGERTSKVGFRSGIGRASRDEEGDR